MLIVVWEWLGGVLFVDDGCCWYELIEFVNVASPVECVLSLFYLCASQIYPVCVGCVVTYDIVFVCLLSCDKGHPSM